MQQHPTIEPLSCPRCNGEPCGESGSIWPDRRISLIAVSAVLFSIGLISAFVFSQTGIATILFGATAILTGYHIAREGFETLFLQHRLSIDFLITLASIGSFVIGHSEEGAAVVFLFYIAEWLEDRASDRARQSISSLVELAPEVTQVRKNGEVQEMCVQDIEIGDVILIKPGERIPLDGVVVLGSTSINQAPITGEALPVSKTIGDEVFAGTINNEGYLEIQVTKWSDETVLAKIVTLVDEAQRVKSPTETFIDRFAKYYTPFIILLAIGVAILPSILFALPFTESLYRALVLLVVSCPCALAISTPVAMVSGMTSAAKNGVLIKGSSYIEALSQVKVFAFDKTGTLTQGRLVVTDIVGFDHPEEEVLLKAACIEALSEHPIAQAIIQAVKESNGIQDINIQDFQVLTGKGATCSLDGEPYYVGNGRMFRERGILFPEAPVKNLENAGKTVVLVGTRKEAIGLIAVTDKIRRSSPSTIHELKEMGIRTEMITGDNDRTANFIARKVGVDEYHAELLPDEKVSIIGNHLMTDFGQVAMVGDGINDAPALASASVGIAMGVIGSDLSLESADIALMEDDLSKLPFLVRLSRKTMTIVKQNVITSILIKAVFAILAIPGLVTLWLAVAIGDMGLSLAVILNSMRLSRTDA
jgi:Cd2+/Zn2+-exporting ATPase